MLMSNDNPKATPPPRPVPQSGLVSSRFQEEHFWKGVRKSIGVHAAAVIALLLLTLVLPREPVKYQPSIRIDLVGLPDLKKSDLARAQPDDFERLSEKLKDGSSKTQKLAEQARNAKSAEPEPTPADDAANSMALKKIKPRPEAPKTPAKKDLKSAIERIKAIAALEDESKPPGQKKTVAMKGNKVSRGDSSAGGPAMDTNAFIGALQAKLRDNWNLPVWLGNQNLSAKIVIFLSRDGYVNNTIVAKSSGNQQFDDYCLKTIRTAQPFGAPPSDIVNEGLTLGFPL